MKIKSMKAAILTEQNKPLVIDEIYLPETLSYGQVLVKIFYTGICGSQLGEINGAKGPDKFLPHLLGHEACGQVVECGPNVSNVQEGDTVILHWRKGKGIDAEPPKYQWNGKTVNAGFVTTFNEYAVVSENRVTSIPKDFPKDIAALFGCAVTTGFGVITNNAQCKIGDSVLVYGAGGVGLNIVQAASMSSAYPIIAIDRIQEKLDLAKHFGATHIVNSETEDVKKIVTDIVGSGGVDFAIDNTGNAKVVEACYKLTHAQGKTILVGVVRKDEEISLYPLPLHFGKTLTGSHGGECCPTTDIPKYLRLYEQNKLNLKSLITNRYQLDDINTAIEDMKNNNVIGRCIIKVSN